MKDINKYELNWNEMSINYNNRIQKEYKSEKNKLWDIEIARHCKDINKSIINVLDVGTGPGFFPMLLDEEKFHITAIDKFEDMLTIACNNNKERKNVEFRNMSAEELDFEDGSFDLVIVRNMSYTLSEPEKAFKEWYRVLTVGGRLLIYDANWWYFVFCEEEKKKVDAYLEEYHKKTDKEHSTYEKECRMEWDSIITRPLSKVKRPEWDYEFYKKLGVDEIVIEQNVGDLVNTEKEQYKSLPTPLFLVKVVKNK